MLFYGNKRGHCESNRFCVFKGQRGRYIISVRVFPPGGFFLFKEIGLEQQGSKGARVQGCHSQSRERPTRPLIMASSAECGVRSARRAVSLLITPLRSFTDQNECAPLKLDGGPLFTTPTPKIIDINICPPPSYPPTLPYFSSIFAFTLFFWGEKERKKKVKALYAGFSLYWWGGGRRPLS